MKNNITSPIFKQLKSSDLLSDIYQRDLDAPRVRRIIKEFNPALVNPIKVSHRNGLYYVIDGQHTLAALRTMNGDKDLMVDCIIFEGLTQQDEAYLFAQQTGISKKVDSGHKLQALYIAGDEKVTDMHDIVNSLGFLFDFSSNKAAKRITSGAMLWRMYNRSTRREFIDSLEIVRDAWKFKPDSLKNEILGGVNSFYIYPDYKGLINKKTAIQKLGAVEPYIFIREGKVCMTKFGDLRFAKQMEKVYSYNLRNNRLPHPIGGIY